MTHSTAGAGAPTTTGAGAAPTGPAWHTLSVEDALAQAGVTAAAGLSPAEVTKRAAIYGPNAFTAGATEPFIKRFLRQYADPMQLVLLVAGLVSWFVTLLGLSIVVVSEIKKRVWRVDLDVPDASAVPVTPPAPAAPAA